MAKTKKEAPPAETSNPLSGKSKTTKKYLSQQKEVIPKKANTLDMVVEAVDANTERKGSSLQYIKKYISEKYPDGDLKSFVLKKALVKAVQDEILLRPKATEDAHGMSGRFKINKDRVKNGKIMKPKKAVKKTEPQESDEESSSKTKKDKVSKKTKKGKNDENSDGDSKVSKLKKTDKKAKADPKETTKKTEPKAGAKDTKKVTKSKATNEKTAAVKDTKETKSKVKAKTAVKKVTKEPLVKKVSGAKEPLVKKLSGKSKANRTDSEVYEDNEDSKHAEETAKLKLTPPSKKKGAKGKKKVTVKAPEDEEEEEDEEKSEPEEDAVEEADDEGEEEDAASDEEVEEEEETASDNDYQEAKPSKRTNVVLKGKKIEADADGSLKLDLSGSSKDAEEEEEEEESEDEEPVVPVKRNKKGR